MQTLNLKQGSKEWLDTRAQYCTASEAPAMMNVSKYMTRQELIHQKKTGEVKEVDSFTQGLFDKGHAIEAAIRPYIEEIIGEELYPTTGVDDIGNIPLLASFDGLTMMEEIVFECKSWNEELATSVKNKIVPESHKWQLEQQLLISNADKAIFVVSDGTIEKTVYCFYEATESDKLLNGWKQFMTDLESYEPKAKKAEVIADTIETLPALIIQIKGAVTNSNLSQYQKVATQYIENINTELQTDQDFANAEADVKFCKNAEKELKAVKEAAINSTVDIAEVMRVMDNISSQIRDKRLMLDKSVKAEKQNRKLEIAHEAKHSYEVHVRELETELNGISLNINAPNWNDALKGLRTIDSLENAANSKLAEAKIEADQAAKKIRSNLALFSNLTNDSNSYLFNDKARIIALSEHDLKEVINSRIIAEENRIEATKKAEAERIEREAKQAEAEKQQRLEDERLEKERLDSLAEDKKMFDEAQTEPQRTESTFEEKPTPIVTEPVKQSTELTMAQQVHSLCDAYSVPSNFQADLFAILESHDIVLPTAA